MNSDEDKSKSIKTSKLSIREICKAPAKRHPRNKQNKQKETVNRDDEEQLVGEVLTDDSVEEGNNTSNTIQVKRVTQSKPKIKRIKKWEKEEVMKLYRGLLKYGTDFGLIELTFNDRTRKQIKAKFKSEERIRPKVIEKVLNSKKLVDDEELLKETMDLISKQQGTSSEEDSHEKRNDNVD